LSQPTQKRETGACAPAKAGESAAGVSAFALDARCKANLTLHQREFDTLQRFAQHELLRPENIRLIVGQRSSFRLRPEKRIEVAFPQIDLRRNSFFEIG
jgi:hypothetical protein